MQSDAPALPLAQPSTRGARARLPRWAGAREQPRRLAGGRLAAVSLGAIVALSLFIVLIAANRPSLLTPTTHGGFFPRWMAGPLGGLLPGLTDNSTALRFMVTAAVVVMFVAYAWLLRSGVPLPVRWVVGAIVAVHVIFVLSPPLALTDMFNYINYGRMEVVHGLNPYTTLPVLEPHSDPSYLLSNWHELLSPYGPLFTLLTFAVVPLGVAGSFWALKVLIAAASLGSVLLVWKCARLLGRDPLVAAVLVGLNPIVLVWGLGAGHNDSLMIICIMVGFYLLLRSRPYEPRGGVEQHAGASRAARVRSWLLPPSAMQMLAGAGFVAAAGVKASAALLIPVVLASLLRAPRAFVQVLAGMLVSALLVLIASLLAFGLHIPSLSTQGSLVTSESVPNLIGLALGLGGESNGLRAVMAVVLIGSVLACCWLAWRRRDAIGPSGWAGVALLVTLSWVLPWYVLWILPMAALSSSRRLRATALVLGAYLIIVWMPVSNLLWSALHFHPERTPLGRLHQRYVRELLN